MKKLVFIFMAFTTFKSVNAQSEPGKIETFNYIVDLIEGGCQLGIVSDFTVISRDEDNFKVTIKGNKKTSNYSLTNLYYLEFKNLIDKSDITDNTVRIRFNKPVKVQGNYTNGNTADFSNRNYITIDLCNSENQKRLVKALKHFWSLQNKTGSFFDD